MLIKGRVFCDVCGPDNLTPGDTRCKMCGKELCKEHRGNPVVVPREPVKGENPQKASQKTRSEGYRCPEHRQSQKISKKNK